MKNNQGMNIERGKKGQSVLEYAVLLSVLCLVFLSMMYYMKNSINSRLRVVQDRTNEAVRH